MDDLSDKWVSKSIVLEKLQTTEFAHIACHGIFEIDAPSDSGLVFSSKTGEKDTLNLKELDALNLEGLQLITLSSCWAADNFVLPGRWIISLPETLWRAGAASVFGCLWKVYDTVAAAFMDRFYYYLSENMSLDEALQATQIDCLNTNLKGCGSDIDTTDPLIWSGFNLYGAYRRFTL